MLQGENLAISLQTLTFLKTQSNPQHTTNKPASIRCLFDPWIRDPGSGMSKKSEAGSGMNNPDHISESLETTFGVKILKFFDADPGWENLDPGWKKFEKKNWRPVTGTLGRCRG